MKSRINNSLRFPGKSWLLVLFLSAATFTQGQDKDKNGTIVTDTIEVITPATDEEAVSDTSGTEQPYFSVLQDTLHPESRELPSDAVKKWKKDKDFWYADSVLRHLRNGELAGDEKENGQPVQPDNSYTPLGQRSWFQALLWIVILGVFITGLIIYLGGDRIGLFRKKIISTKEQEEAGISEDIFAINYQKEIDKAAAQGNYRLAIRLQFLRLLKNLSEKNIIRYKQDKTNMDYLVELQPTTHYTHFFRITRNYEYSWYGQFPVSEETYRVIRGDFDNLDKELASS